MLIGMLLLPSGCWLISNNEYKSLARELEVTDATSSLVESACGLVADTVLPGTPPFVHLEDCKVRSTNLNETALGVKELAYFEDLLPPNAFNGAWLRVFVEMYSGGPSAEWISVAEAGVFKAVEVLAKSVHIGDFKGSDDLIRMIPGSTVLLQPGGQPSSRGRVHGEAVYFGDPLAPRHGDVRAKLVVGSADHVSVLAAADGAGRSWELRLWKPGSRHWLYGLTDSFPLGAVEAGPAPWRELLAQTLPPRRANLWPIRVVGFLMTWFGMALLLFPNHVIPDFCGGWCCCRSLAGGLATALFAAASSQCYVRAPLVSEACALILVPVLLLAAMDVKPWRRPSRRSRRSSRDREVYVKEDTAAHGLLSGLPLGMQSGEGIPRPLRMALLGAGLALVMAGPMVRAVAFADLFSDWYDAFSQ